MPGWGGDGLRPHSSDNGPGHGASWWPSFGRYGDAYPRGGERPNLGVCRAYPPGAQPDLPDGGLVCTRDIRAVR